MRLAGLLALCAIAYSVRVHGDDVMDVVTDDNFPAYDDSSSENFNMDTSSLSSNSDMDTGSLSPNSESGLTFEMERLSLQSSDSDDSLRGIRISNPHSLSSLSYSPDSVPLSLLDAVEQGNLGQVINMAPQDSTINTIINWEGTPALIIATKNEYTDIVEFILSIPGVDVNIVDGNGETALQVAKLLGNETLALLLLRHGATDSQVNM